MKKIALGVFVSAAAMSAHAQSDFKSKMSADLLIGFADHKTSFHNGAGSETGNDISFGVRGAYSVNKNVAVELAYQDYGETEGTYFDRSGNIINDRVSASAITAGLKGSYPLQNGLTLSARLGASMWDVEARQYDSSLPTPRSGEDDGTGVYYGVGAEYALNEKFSVGAEYTVTDMRLAFEEITADHDVRNVAAFISYSY